MRPTSDEVWMDVARAVSKRSRCVNRQVGAVIVTSQNRMAATGYNGPPAGLEVSGQCGGFCPRAQTGERGVSYGNCVSVHAEANALLFASRREIEGGTIYVTNPCCWDCAKLVANSGLDKVVVARGKVDERFDFTRAKQLLEVSGLKVIIREEVGD